MKDEETEQAAHGFLWNFYDRSRREYEAILDPLIMGLAKEDFKKKSKDLKPSQLFDFAMNYRYLSIRIEPAQSKEEITKLMDLIKRANVKTMMEIGTLHGGTLFLFSRVIDKNAMILCNNLSDGRPQKTVFMSKIALFKAFIDNPDNMHFIYGSSHDDKTLRETKRLLQKNKLDFLFIDADHSYEGVKADYVMYSPLVRKGGIIAFHDVAGTDDVKTFWNEEKRKHRNVKVFAVPKSTMGIGVIVKE